jgi:hypothetical protein
VALTKVSNSMLVQPVNHNLLINPSFTVMQRGGVIDRNETTYGPDRWKVRGIDKVGGTMAQYSTDSSSGINKLVVKHRNATSYSNIYQKIEAVNILGLYGKEVTFSFSYSDVGGSGIPSVWIVAWDSSDTVKTLLEATPTSLGDNRWSCTVTLTTLDGTIPDPSMQGMQVSIYADEKNTAPAEWSVWETKLEAGSVATPFIARTHGEELALCQRYYETFPKVFSVAIDANPSAKYVQAFMQVEKRAVPTVSYSVLSEGTFSNRTGDTKVIRADHYSTTGFANVNGLTADAEL